MMLNKTWENLEYRLYAVARRLIMSIQNCESQLLQSCQDMYVYIYIFFFAKLISFSQSDDSSYL